MNKFSFVIVQMLLASWYTALAVQARTTDNRPCVYVSNLGDDHNSGLSADKPLKTLAAAMRTGKDIKLKCGDVFYENVSLDGQNLSAYGKGKKPKLCGWKYLTGARWEHIDSNIWRIDLEDKGHTGRQTSGSPFFNDVGLIRDTQTGRIFGVKHQHVYQKDCTTEYGGAQTNTWLKNEMDFAQTPVFGRGKLQRSDFKYLYLYSSKDPNTMHLAVSTYENGVTAQNAVIDGIAIEGFGCHGVAANSNTTITHCEITNIGGSQQCGYVRWVRFGNGIEFYISQTKKNGYAAHNDISHTFDCGATIQASGAVGAYPENIIFENNKIHHCRQAFEYFMRNNDPKSGEKYDCRNCAFRHNLCIDNGHNGFGTTETRNVQILSYHSDYVASIVIEDNIFVGGGGLYFANHPEDVRFGKNNRFYLTEGTTLWTPYDGKDRIVYESRNLQNVKQRLAEKGVDIAGVKLIKVSGNRLRALERKFMKKRP